MSADQENIAVGSKHLRHIDRRWARREGASTLIGRAGSRSGNRGVGAKRGVGVGAKRRLHRKPRLLSYRTRSLQRERSFFSARVRTVIKLYKEHSLTKRGDPPSGSGEGEGRNTWELFTNCLRSLRPLDNHRYIVSARGGAFGPEGPRDARLLADDT